MAIRRTTTPTTPTTPRTTVTTPTGPVAPSTPSGPVAPTDAFTNGTTTPATGRSTQLGNQLFLSPSGHFVSRAGQDKPATPVDLGEALTRAADLANRGVNSFARPEVTLQQKTAALSALTEAFALGGDASKFNGNKDQALQTRASAGPLLLDLITSLDASKTDQAALRTKAIGAYFKALDTEPHGLLRNFMLFDLDRVKGKLPDAVKAQVNDLMREVAPLTPPYEDWFKNGETTMRVEYYVGAGFWEEELSAYENEGFTRTNNADGTVTLKKHYDAERALNNGTTEKFKTDVELVMHNGPEGMFTKMNDPKVAGVVYSGHANYGREVPSHLGDAPAMNGSKAFFALQCGGKGVHNALLEKYPDLQVVSSKNSSYGHQDRATFLNTLEGVSKRLPWSAISGKNTSDNYYFPSDTLIGRRSHDLDHDGNVDAWDRVLTVNPFHAQAQILTQLTPKDPAKPVEALDGRAITGAMLRFWRMAGYNEWAEGLKDQGVVANGFFKGTSSDPMFKTTEVTGEDGEKVIQLQVNSRYSHASEEVMGAAMHYELGRQAAAKAGLSASDAKAAGLLMAAEALNVDTGSNERDAWAALVKYAKLPAGVSFEDAMAANHQDETYPAGGRKTVELFKKALADKHITLP